MLAALCQALAGVQGRDGLRFRAVEQLAPRHWVTALGRHSDDEDLAFVCVPDWL